MKTKTDLNSNINQEIKGKFVEREIKSNFSSMLEDCFKTSVYNYEDIENLFFKDNEEDAQEIFEWWNVSEFLYNKLKEKGEPVFTPNNFNYFWGRTCSGQAILLDSVISEICNEMEILDGQKFSWSK